MDLDPLAPPITNEEDAINPAALQQALRQMGRDALNEAFHAGLSVLIGRQGHLIRLHPDGREDDLGVLPETVLANGHE